MLAYIADADVTATTGAITLAATEDATIKAVSVAASLAVSVGFIGGTLAGAGAAADNIILGSANAWALDSELDAKTDVSITAENTSEIDANIIAAAVSLAGSAIGGAAVGIGVSVARNFVGWDASIDHDSGEAVPTLDTGDTVFVSSGAQLGQVYKYKGATLTDGDPGVIDNQPIELATQIYGNGALWERVDRPPVQEVRAYAQNTGIDAEGDLTLTATSDQTIDATVIAGSVGM